MKKVMVSGCFDLLHSGHIIFLRLLQNTASYMCVLAQMQIFLN